MNQKDLDLEDSEQNIYGDDARENMMDDDEISPEEEAFMKGYEEAEDKEEESDDEDYENSFKE